MSIANPKVTNFTSGELSPRLEGRVDLSKYYNGCRRLQNFHVHPHGGATRRSGLRHVGQALGQDVPSLLVGFEFNTEQTYILEFAADENDHGRMRVFKDQGRVLDGQGQVYEMETPWGADDLDRLKWAQSHDTLIVVHPDYAPRRITRSGHADWSIEAIAFTGQPDEWGENNWPGAVCFFEERLVLAGVPDRPSTIWFSRTGEYFDFRTLTREVPLKDWNDFEIKNAAGGARSGVAGHTFAVYAGDAFEKGSVLRGQNTAGEKRWYRYLGSRTFVSDTEDQTITFVDSPTTSTHIESVWTGGSLNTAKWEAFELGERIEAEPDFEPLDDDGIEITLNAAQANAIEFLVPKSRLWVGTVGGEWTVGGTGTGEPITPSSAKASQEGTAGAAQSAPVAVGAGTLFIQRAGRKVREMAYRFDADAFVSQDLTILSEHVTGTGLTQLAYAQEPDSLVYCVRSDGVLLSLTYQRDQEVVAWARHVTDGEVLRIASIYNGDESRDELWAVVRRQVGGEGVCMIEFLEAEFRGPLADAFFVDSGLSYDGEPTSTLSGLDHLAGREVHVLADGAVQSPKTVDAGGTITLDRPASKVHAGLPYASVLQPMRLEGGSARGTGQTKPKRIVQVAARFYQTLGGAIGVQDGRMEPVYFRTPAAPMGQAPELFSGDKTVKFPQGWSADGLLTIEQDQPLPMSILMLVPEVVINS